MPDEQERCRTPHLPAFALAQRPLQPCGGLPGVEDEQVHLRRLPATGCRLLNAYYRARVPLVLKVEGRLACKSRPSDLAEESQPGQ